VAVDETRGGFDGKVIIATYRPTSLIWRLATVDTDVSASAMQAYLDWEYGLVDQLRRDGTHGFFVI
jgi:hypothetical protein